MEPRPVPGEDFWRLEDDAAYAAAASAALRRHVDAHGDARWCVAADFSGGCEPRAVPVVVDRPALLLATGAPLPRLAPPRFRYEAASYQHTTPAARAYLHGLYPPRDADDASQSAADAAARCYMWSGCRHTRVEAPAAWRHFGGRATGHNPIARKAGATFDPRFEARARSVCASLPMLECSPECGACGLASRTQAGLGAAVEVYLLQCPATGAPTAAQWGIRLAAPAVCGQLVGLYLGLVATSSELDNGCSYQLALNHFQEALEATERATITPGELPRFPRHPEDAEGRVRPCARGRDVEPFVYDPAASQSLAPWRPPGVPDALLPRRDRLAKRGCSDAAAAAAKPPAAKRAATFEAWAARPMGVRILPEREAHRLLARGYHPSRLRGAGDSPRAAALTGGGAAPEAASGACDTPRVGVARSQGAPVLEPKRAAVAPPARVRGAASPPPQALVDLCDSDTDAPAAAALPGGAGAAVPGAVEIVDLTDTPAPMPVPMPMPTPAPAPALPLVVDLVELPASPPPPPPPSNALPRMASNAAALASTSSPTGPSAAAGQGAPSTACGPSRGSSGGAPPARSGADATHGTCKAAAGPHSAEGAGAAQPVPRTTAGAHEPCSADSDVQPSPARGTGGVRQLPAPAAEAPSPAPPAPAAPPEAAPAATAAHHTDTCSALEAGALVTAGPAAPPAAPSLGAAAPVPATRVPVAGGASEHAAGSGGGGQRVHEAAATLAAVVPGAPAGPAATGSAAASTATCAPLQKEEPAAEAPDRASAAQELQALPAPAAELGERKPVVTRGLRTFADASVQVPPLPDDGSPAASLPAEGGKTAASTEASAATAAPARQSSAPLPPVTATAAVAPVAAAADAAIAAAAVDASCGTSPARPAGAAGTPSGVHRAPQRRKRQQPGCDPGNVLWQPRTRSAAPAAAVKAEPGGGAPANKAAPCTKNCWRPYSTVEGLPRRRDFAAHFEHLLVDAEHVGNAMRFCNHSCEPNLVAQTVFRVDAGCTALYYYAFFAGADLRAGTPLTWDYKWDSDVARSGVAPAGVKCLCGAKTCRGVLR